MCVFQGGDGGHPQTGLLPGVQLFLLLCVVQADRARHLYPVCGFRGDHDCREGLPDTLPVQHGQALHDPLHSVCDHTDL